MNSFFDPSKMDPKALMEMSQLIQQLPPEQLSRMQTLMHNMMAGFDVRLEMEEFEKGLPAGFREKLMAMMGGQAGTEFTPAAQDVVIEPLSKTTEPKSEMDLREARLTILRAVSEKQISPDEAEKLLFKA